MNGQQEFPFGTRTERLEDIRRLRNSILDKRSSMKASEIVEAMDDLRSAVEELSEALSLVTASTVSDIPEIFKYRVRKTRQATQYVRSAIADLKNGWEK